MARAHLHALKTDTHKYTRSRHIEKALIKRLVGAFFLPQEYLHASDYQAQFITSTVHEIASLFCPFARRMSSTSIPIDSLTERHAFLHPQSSREESPMITRAEILPDMIELLQALRQKKVEVPQQQARLWDISFKESSCNSAGIHYTYILHKTSYMTYQQQVQSILELQSKFTPGARSYLAISCSKKQKSGDSLKGCH